jgi:hypothetical protein
LRLLSECLSANSFENLVLDKCKLIDVDLRKNTVISLELKECSGSIILGKGSPANYLICFNRESKKLRINIQAKCNVLKLTGQLGLLSAQNLHQATTIEESQLTIVDLEELDRELFGRVVSSKMHFPTPSFDGLRFFETKRLVSALGEKYLRMNKDWGHVDIFNVVMDPDQFKKYMQEPKNGNRMSIYVYEFAGGQELASYASEYSWTDVVEFSENYIAVFPQRCDAEKAKTVDELMHSEGYEEIERFEKLMAGFAVLLDK